MFPMRRTDGKKKSPCRPFLDGGAGRRPAADIQELQGGNLMTPLREVARPEPRGGSILTVVLKVLALLAPWMAIATTFAQERDPTLPPPQTFHHAAGVRIDVTPTRPDVTDAEVLAALEDAARQVRERLVPTVAATAYIEDAPARPAKLPPDSLAVPLVVGIAPAPAEDAPDAVHEAGRHLQLFPSVLLWQPPMANQHEPRMEIEATTLDNANTKKTLDTIIGGTAPALGWVSDDCPQDGWQLDFFAAALSRFSKYNTLDDVDYRFGLPLTWASGPWSGKLAYEHTSSHIGDDFIKWDTGLQKRGHVRDEGVVGLSYLFWNQLRFYGQFGYAFNMATSGPNRHDRYDFGVEWSRRVSTGFRGQPFAALDIDIRGDEDYTPNLTAQIGWQWQELGSRLSSLRLALEFYDGRSPFGQFFDVHEQWLGAGIFLDF
jgi:hypothetical protein